jgi:hypothetical protein
MDIFINCLIKAVGKWQTLRTSPTYNLAITYCTKVGLFSHYIIISLNIHNPSSVRSFLQIRIRPVNQCFIPIIKGKRLDSNHKNTTFNAWVEIPPNLFLLTLKQKLELGGRGYIRTSTIQPQT